MRKFLSPIVAIAFTAAVLLARVGGGVVLAGDILSQAYIEDLKHVTVGDDRKREEPPAVDKPRFISMTDASLYMEPGDVVFVEEPESGIGQVFIYPRAILVLHEVVNLRQHGPKRSITYSPLTGSVVGIYARTDELFSSSFGTMGMLVNSNRILYDRSTNSLCPQMLQTCIRGPLKNKALRRFPLLWTTWRNIRKRYPGALVLSKETGWRMDYGRDPYGSYARSDSYYQKGGVYFPIAHRDNMLPPKTRVIGVSDCEQAVAVHENRLRKELVATLKLKKRCIAAFYDTSIGAVRMYIAHADGLNLTFELVDGEIVDLETRSRWDVLGNCTSGRLRGSKLERAVSLPCMWFAWKAFHPSTLIWQGNGNDMLTQLSQ